MRRAFRRILVVLCVLLGIVVIAAVVLLVLVQSAPSYYQPLALTGEQLESAAKRVEDKLVEIRNIAGEGAPQDTVYVVTFTQDELNAFLTKWTSLPAVRSSIGGRITAPAVVLRKDGLIFAASVDAGQINSIVGVELQPKLDEDGQLALPITSVWAGKLPMPRDLIIDQLAGPLDALRRELPKWRQGAQLQTKSAGGSANDDAMRAFYAQTLLSIVEQKPLDSIFLIPLDGDRGVPARLVKVEMSDGEITLHARLLTTQERVTLIDDLRGG